ncbi:Protein SMALL AUXIN UP-REGULATED RNA 16 [Linum perenne]
MAPTTSKNKGSVGGIINLKIVAKKLQKSLNSLGKKPTNVPGDVKEGHFTVLAVEGVEEPQRFIVPLSYLTHPTFLRLLEQAAEEFGFDGREGALAVPCRPSELETILAERDVKEGHFAVLAVEGIEEPQRFVVPLSYLTHPTFMRLLEQAAEEYGFDGHEGALAVPCRPSEFQRILAELWEETTSSRGRNGGGRDGSWGSSSCKTMVRSF